VSFINELKRRNVLRVAAAYVVTAWLVIQVVETIFPAFGYGDVAVRIVTIVFGIGLVPSLIFAWAFELTPEGLKKEKDVDRSQSIAPHTGRKLDRMIMVVLALALGYFAFDKFVLNPQREAVMREQVAGQVEEARQEGRAEALVEFYGDKSIAVLPFVNMSSDEEQEYFSDGISEELLNLLAKIPDLRVISRSSAFSFKGQNLEIPEIAQRLNVAHILEGSVRKSGNQVRITAQLIDARSDTHLWSEAYDRQLDNIFAIQDEIAAEVVSQLQITLLGENPQSQVVDTQAYALYLQGRHIRQNQRDAAGTLKAEQLQLAALDIQPDYLDAWVELVAIYWGQGRASVLSLKDTYLKMSEAAAGIEALDSRNPTVLIQRALEARYAGRFEDFAALIQEVFEEHPANPDARFWTYVVLKGLMRYDEAVALYGWFQANDPTSCATPGNIGSAWMLKGDYAKAIAASSRAVDLCGGFPRTKLLLTQARVLLERPAEALKEAEREQDPNYRQYALAIAHDAMGNEAQSAKALEELQQRYAEDPKLSILIASAHAFRGEPEEAFDWLAKMDEDLALEVEFRWDMPEFVPLRDDPRWMALVDRYWLTPDELAAIKFEVTLPK
jgi:TolB-like protein